MTLELTRRLIDSGVVGLTELDMALLASAVAEVPLLQVLQESHPELTLLVEREISTSKAPGVVLLRPVEALLRRLPPGLCERLLALPVRVDPRTGSVDVAVADPLDSHVPHELAFHLGVEVRVLRAPIGDVRAALERLGESERPEATKSIAPESSSNLPSSPPIPLVQRAKEREPQAKSLRHGTHPGLGRPSLIPPPDRDERGEPVLSLSRSKLSHEPIGVPESSIEERLGLLHQQMEEVGSADEVAEFLAQGLGLFGASLVFALRTNGFQGRASSGLSFDAAQVRSLFVSAQAPSVLSIASDAGYYLGPLPQTETHRALRAVLPEVACEELYVLPIVVSDRVALVALVGGFRETAPATRRANETGRVASTALERIVRERRQRGGG